MALVAFKIQDGIHDMLQQFGTGNHSLLRHVPDKEYRHARSFGIPHELARHFLHLADRSGSGRDLVGIDGLNGIHDQGRRTKSACDFEHLFERGFR